MITLSVDFLPSRALKQLMRLQLLQRQPTRRDTEVPLVFRERCLLSGYRIPNKSWTVYELCSTFDVYTDPLSWPVLAFSMVIILYASFSTFAHLFQSKSPLIHYTCFQIDYIGIGLNAFGTGCLFYYLTGSQPYYDVVGPTLFMTLNALLAVADCMTCSIAKLWYIRPYPPQRRLWQLGSVGFHVLFGGVPLLCHFKSCLLDDPECDLYYILPHLHTFFWFFLSVYFFSSAIPERLAPGRFDYVGHGHQLFHTLMIVTSLLQIRVAILELGRRPRDLIEAAMPDPVVIFGSMAAVLILDALFIILTHWLRVAMVARDAIREQESRMINGPKRE
ncbi:hypothetical protein LSH36_13g10046 [Paralvinella palmiformis]|uniref:Uncharacterized protein n=1 Tax=Paralvinella palmiformis TaxID=53620 RepID=A0AAD9KDW6_9ANNE|nr:hypothetical protein LSH36_13g10046 [Paralvinella palmiformis]